MKEATGLPQLTAAGGEATLLFAVPRGEGPDLAWSVLAWPGAEGLPASSSGAGPAPQSQSKEGLSLQGSG